MEIPPRIITEHIKILTHGTPQVVDFDSGTYIECYFPLIPPIYLFIWMSSFREYLKDFIWRVFVKKRERERESKHSPISLLTLTLTAANKIRKKIHMEISCGKSGFKSLLFTL